MFTTGQYTIIFKKNQATRYLRTFSFFNKMEKHNRRAPTKRGGIFSTAFTLISTPGIQKRRLKLKLDVL